jgi:ABC-type oligopeptide transport system substrate-binding subunit
MRLPRFLLLTGLLAIFAVGSASAKENVVQLPYFDNIPSFVPYYWQSQHILAQGTIFEGLFGYAPDPTGLGGVKVVPVIADKWTVSPDGKTWTVTLRKDKKWSNGDPITAHDFEWTYKYMVDPKIPDVPLWANHVQFLKNGWEAKGGGVAVDDLGVKATDDYTLLFTLNTSRYDFNCWLVVAGSMPLHRATVEKWGANEWWKPEHFVGNGPYVPASWTPNKEAVLVKNKNYVGTVGNVDKIVLKNFAAGASHIQAYQSGELDLAWVSNVADYKFATNNAALKTAFHETPNDLFWAGFQITRGFNKVMDDIKVRKAFAMAIDRETLARTVLSGRVFPAGKYWTDSDPIGKAMKGIPFDVAGAKKLLAEAGYPDGKGLPQLKFFITGNMPEVEFVVDQWKKNLGVNVLVDNLENGVYWNQYVWANWTPDAPAGFTRINAPMNSFEAGALDKNAVHTPLFYDYPTSVRKKDYDLEQVRIGFLTKNGGLTEADWKSLVAQKDSLLAKGKAIISKEPNKQWVEDMSRKPGLAERFDELYANWKKATTDKDKTELWRQASRMLIDVEKGQVEYNGMNPSNKAARRARYEMLSVPFEKAVQVAPKVNQIEQDQYYMIPLYIDKAQYLLRPSVTGLMVYKFSWGPAVFNLKYLNVK